MVESVLYHYFLLHIVVQQGCKGGRYGRCRMARVPDLVMTRQSQDWKCRKICDPLSHSKYVTRYPSQVLAVRRYYSLCA